MAKYAKIKNPKKKKKRFRTLLFFTYSMLIICIAYTFTQFDKKVLPPVLASVDKSAKTRINKAINNSIVKISTDEDLQATDFYRKSENNNGEISSLAVNTVLVNDFCAKLAVEISEELNNMEPESVKIPIGAVFDINVFSNLGPSYPISVTPIGNAIVDYETKFESVGINQINFQLWLKVDSSVKVINPIQNQDIIVSRKIALVNTVFSGQVPETYLNNIPISEVVPSK